MQLSQVQAKHDECMEQLAIKSKELANTKSELLTMQQQRSQTEQQVSSHFERIRRHIYL